jgi:hypothetical protein
MSKHLHQPASRLICVGGARRSTNAVVDLPRPELDPDYGYDD